MFELRKIIRNICYRNMIQIGGSKKILKIEYNKKIELKFKMFKTNNGNIEIYLSNEINKNEISDINSCIFIQINKNEKEVHIHGITSSTLLNCFSDPEFILKKAGSFYLQMTIKMLKKYKNKLKINKITLQDNAIIKPKYGESYNLSQFKLLTEGFSWYEKYGFKINKKTKKQHQINKEIINKIKIKDVKLENIILNVKNKKLPNNYLKPIIKYIKENQNEKLMKIMKEIFIYQRTDYTDLLYSLIIEKILRNIEKNNDNYEKYKPTSYYMRL